MMRSMTRYFWLVLLAVLVPSAGHATTYYVATNGSNSNNGTSESTPFLTVAYCASTMVAGDTCFVRGGTYAEGVIRFGVTGTQASPIKLLNYPNERPIINFIDSTQFHRIVIQSFSHPAPMGWITIEGFEINGGWEAIKFYNLHDSVIRRNELKDSESSGVLGLGGHDNLFTQNIIRNNGDRPRCLATLENPECNLRHGMYMHGQNYTLTHNLIYDNLSLGITQNGSSSSAFSSSLHAGPEFADATGWIITNNVIAYQFWTTGENFWGGRTNGTRSENNILYENATQQSSSHSNSFSFTSPDSDQGVNLRNNLAYATGSGGQQFVAADDIEGTHFIQSNNVINTTAPGFVNGGSNALPVSPDFSLVAGAGAIGVARANEFPRNATLTAGAFDAIGDPTCSITENKITCTFPMNNATPIQNLSTAGLTVGCTGTACPGSPVPSSVSRIAGTDSQIEIVVGGITNNACESANQTWTLTYDSTTGTWTGNDNIGPHPGLHQKVFSVTNHPITNNCTGSGPPSNPGSPYIEYVFDEGTGTTATNSGSLGASGNGTLQNGVTWANGGGVTMANQSTQYVSIPYGNGVNPSTQNLTIAFTVDIPVGSESLARTFFGSPLGADQRLYLSMASGTLRMGVQGVNDGTATELSVDSGPQHVCMTVNATTDQVTLHKNGVASTAAGGVRAITSYTLSGDFELGRLPTLTNGGNFTYRHFVIYQTVEDCNDLYLATQGPPTDPPGVFSQTAVQAQDVFLPSAGGSPTVLSYPNNTKKVVKGGGVAWVFQLECDDCDETTFRLEARDNGAGGWFQVPDTPTAGNVYMWGADSNPFLNDFDINNRLTGSCTIITGTTILTASQVPNYTLPTSGCVMLRYIVRVTDTASGYTEFRVTKEGGVAFTGTYALARIDVIDDQSGGMGF